MSGWFGTLAGNVENLLDRVDHAAGQAFLKEEDSSTYFNELDEQKEEFYRQDWQALRTVSVVSSSNQSSFVSLAKPSGRLVDSHQSVTTDRLQKSPAAVESGSGVMKMRNGTGVKDPDQELFEFLNSSETTESNTVPVPRTDSRPPSTSSNSSRSRRTPEGGHEVVPSVPSQSMFQGGAENFPAVGSLPHSSSSSSPLEQENQLLKNEVAALSREVHGLVQRLQSTQEELSRSQRQTEAQRRQLDMSERTSTESRRREADAQEALAAKDAQIGVLRTRLEEADRDLAAKSRCLSELSNSRERVLDEQMSTAGVERQTVDALQEKLNDVEAELRREQEERLRANDEATRHLSRLEADKQSLTAELSSLQKSLNRERARSTEIGAQLKTAHLQAESAKQELVDYKDKAARILQSKEKLIVSLKDGTAAVKSSGTELAVLVSELDSTRQERDVVREQLQNMQLALESLRSEMAELEGQMQQDSESAREQISSLEEQLRAERRQREDAEFDVGRQKQELRSMHDELVKQKSGLQSRIQNRDDEIARLRSQLVAKSMNASNQEELENRLHMLTESLIQKQTMLESLSTEKNSLSLQLERMEKQCREAETSAVRAVSAKVNVGDDDEVRQRLPGFMRQSPLDGSVTRQVKMAAGVIEKLGMQLGVFLRRYPVARVLVIVYMAMLHLWVMIVLLTYQPEVHQRDYNHLPLPP